MLYCLLRFFNSTFSIFSEVYEMCFNFNYCICKCIVLYMLVSLEIFSHSNAVEGYPLTQSRVCGERRKLILIASLTQITTPFRFPLAT